MVVGCSYFPLLRLGQPAFAAICHLIIAGVLRGDLARSLGEDTTLNDILQTLDEYYGMVMTFDTLSMELYSLKQGSGENMVKFGVHLLQSVQIVQSEYPGRLQQEHAEEMKQDRFYKGLNPQIHMNVGP